MMMDVWIAPGHGMTSAGRYDVGARAGDKNEQTEGNIIAGYVKEFLAEFDLIVYRQPLRGPNHSGSVRHINESKPKAAIELHHDWSGAPRGGFGFVMNSEQRRLADLIHEEYRRLDLPTRNHLRNLPNTSPPVPPSIIRNTEPTTVLWEVDRIGSVHDHALYAMAIGRGLARFLGLDPNETTSEEPLEEEEAPTPPSRTWTETLVENLPTLRRRTNLSIANDMERRLQGLLAAAGVLAIGPNTVGERFDGKFGPSTEQAVMNFQRRHPHTGTNGRPDGVAGQRTWTALLGR
jgi:hypothetical protein